MHPPTHGLHRHTQFELLEHTPLQIHFEAAASHIYMFEPVREFHGSSLFLNTVL